MSACFLSVRAWDEYVAVIPEEERSDMMKAYHSRLNVSSLSFSLNLDGADYPASVQGRDNSS